MVDGVKIDGLDDLLNIFEDMDISEVKQRKALTLGGDIILQSAVENSPNLTGYTKKNIKKKIIKDEDGDIACRISVDSWDSKIIEFGTSKNKKHIGWFDNSVKDVENEATETMKEVILR